MLNFARLAAVAAFAFVGATTLLAADKGGPVAPPTPAPYQAPAGTIVEPGHFSGIYVEGSVAAVNFKADNVGTESFGLIGLGIGYDHKLAPGVVGGVFARYDLAREDDSRMLHLGARIGATLNPHLLIYAPVTYSMDGASPDLKDGIWSAGLGIETALLSHKLAIFGEVTRNFALQGGAQWLDEVYQFRAGVKYRF
jgi:hypothetical protein